MEYRIIKLGRDYPGKITNFAEARNSFLKKYDWVLFVDDDEEAPQMLFSYLDNLKPTYPYYWVRRVNLLNNQYIPYWNPEYIGRLVSNKVSFFGSVHERVAPKDPHGIIDIPIIHNHVGSFSYVNRPWQRMGLVSRGMLVTKKLIEVARGR